MAKTKLKTGLICFGIFFGIFIGWVFFFSVIMGNYPFCFYHYTVHCWYESKLITEEYVPCSNNDDCSIEKMQDFCSPGHPSLLKCAGARYYCGNEGYCKGCDCFWLLPNHWQVKE